MKLQEKIDRYKIKLWELSKRTRIPQQKIVETVQSAGYFMPKNNPNITLTSNQVEIVALAFVDSVYVYHKKAASNFNELSFDRISEIKGFFSNFIHNSQDLSIEEIFNLKIEDELIKNFFYSIAYAKSNSENVSGLYYILRQLKFKLSKIIKDKRVKIFSFVICNSNHIYPDEEDEHYKLANLNLCFSIVFNNIREALLKTFINLKYFSNGKIKYTY